MELKGKTALVTGSSSGIGQAIAIALAKKGAHILIHYLRNEEGALHTLKEVERHTSGHIYQADLTRREKIEEMFERIKSDAQDVDILINNAGDARSGDMFDERLWDYEYKNIFLSAVHTTNCFLRLSHNSQRKIVNISSIYGSLTMSNPALAQYSAAKAALSNFTVTLAKSHGPSVLVNAIAPGYTLTPAWKDTSEKEKKEAANATVIGRFVETEEIAHAAVFLAENDAMTGQIITMDGGTSLMRNP